MRKLYPLLLSLVISFLPAFSSEENTKEEAEMLQLLESKIDLSKPPNRGEQMFVYLLDENGKQVADVSGLQLTDFSEGLTVFESDAKTNPAEMFKPGYSPFEYGYMNISGKKVIPAQFLKCRKFSEGLASVLSKSQKIGYIDHSGKIVFTKDNCDECNEFSEGLASFRSLTSSNSKWGFLDKSGKTVIEPKYDLALNFSQGRAAVRLDFEWFFIDKSGNRVSPKFDEVYSFTDSIAAVRTGARWGFIDLSGKQVISQDYLEVQPFSDGLASVRKSTLFGFIDTTGKVVIKPTYIKTSSFSQGLCAIQGYDNTWGFIDKTGTIKIQAIYNEVESFSCLRALVKKGWRYGFIDPQGKIVVEPKYVFARPYSQNRTTVMDKNWNHPIMRGELMSMHLKGIKLHKDSTSPSGIYIPVSFDDALKELDDILPPAAKHDIHIIDKEEMIHYHHGFGTWMRNNWCLWKGGALKKDMQRLGFTHPDDMSATIFDSYWLKVRGKTIDLKEKSEYYKAYWDQAIKAKKELDKIPSEKLPSQK
ncbi:MAG: WG repeat-containing protein [Candidatus Melainabacteria bacterium]|nr:MAG: WG repeat-containing protein [Candidatus Melainabacteria bacterium]